MGAGRGILGENAEQKVLSAHITAVVTLGIKVGFLESEARIFA